MTTKFPAPFPSVPNHRWNAAKLGHVEGGHAYAVNEYAIDAESGEQAEVRLLAWIYNDYEDDLRGATATAVKRLPGGQWVVQLRVEGEF
ncbi:hypothetical protein ACFC1B_06855 [Streptomyces xiamenensis]|uniref:hypothetical protein n=1 Tax=Streptomyces xiamenensis TaxID=408015 RepID=UPI0035D83B70